MGQCALVTLAWLCIELQSARVCVGVCPAWLPLSVPLWVPPHALARLPAPALRSKHTVLYDGDREEEEAVDLLLDRVSKLARLEPSVA